MTLQRPRGSEGRTQLRILLAGFASAALLVGAVAPALAASPVRQAATASSAQRAQVRITRTSHVAKFAPIGAVKIGAQAPVEIGAIDTESDNPKHQHYQNPSPTVAIPVTPSLPVVGASTVSGRSGAVGWDAISGAEMRYASPDGQRWNYSLEPPDMALCVGNGYVVQAVNGALQVRSSLNGAELSGVTPMNYFLGYGPEFPSGTSVGDPVCRFDPQTGRFFLSQYLNGGGNVFDIGSVLAVSNSGNPLGGWTVFELDDGGNYTLPYCGGTCFPDYPQLGLDQYGVYLTNNEFSDTGYAGATIWAISKRALTSSSPSVFAWVYGFGYESGVPTAFTIQPASTPNGAYDTSAGGTEYFMSTRDMWGTVDNVLQVWSISNTSVLNLTQGMTPPDWPQRVDLPSQAYACQCAGSGLGAVPGGGATQKYGPYPLGTYGSPPIAPGQQLGRLDTNDDRMHPVVYSNGMLWGAASSVMSVAGSASPTVGVAWWTVSVNAVGGQLGAGIRNQGYIGVKNSYLWFPAVAVSNSVRGVIAMTFSGPDRFPSVAYAQFNPTTGASQVRVAANGVAPADGFTAYDPYTRNGTERWGDYSAAATDAQGNVWFASEYIGPKARSAFLNWGTWIGTVMPF
jgi:hypothetical protein